MADLARRRLLVVAVEAAGKGVLDLVEGEEQHGLSHEGELEDVRRVVRDEQVGLVEQVVDVRVFVDIDELVAVFFFDGDRFGDPGVHLEEDHGVVSAEFIEPVEVDEVVGIVGVEVVLAPVGGREEDDPFAVDHRELLEQFFLLLCPVVRVEELVHTRHAGGEDILRVDAPDFGEEVGDVPAAGDAVFVLAVTAVRSGTARVAPAAVAGGLEPRARVPELDESGVFVQEDPVEDGGVVVDEDHVGLGHLPEDFQPARDAVMGVRHRGAGGVDDIVIFVHPAFDHAVGHAHDVGAERLALLTHEEDGRFGVLSAEQAVEVVRGIVVPDHEPASGFDIAFMEALFEFCHARRVVFLAVIDIEDFEAGLREVHDVEDDAEVLFVFGDRDVDTVPFGLVVVQEGAGPLLQFRGEFRRYFRSTEDVRALAGIDGVGAGGDTHDRTGVGHVQ